MKVLIVDNNAQNRKTMNALIRQQKVDILEGLLEAPNRIMGAMLIDAIDFDLVILGGGLDNVLPDGSIDIGDSISLAKQLLDKNSNSNVVLWSDNQVLQKKFNNLLKLYKNNLLFCFSWLKSISLEEIEHHLSSMSPLFSCHSLGSVEEPLFNAQ